MKTELTAKEKAKELMQRMRLFYGEYLDADGDPKNHYRINKSNAKQCAIIAVDEILSHIQKRIEQLHDSSDKADLKYWQQVKQEIENY